MNEIASLPLALLDFVPVACFLAGGWYVSRMAARIAGRRVWWATVIGTVLVTAGGAAKASAKLAGAAGLGGLDGLGDLHFMLQAPGFVALLLAAICMLRAGDTRAPSPKPVLALAAWKMPLILVMALAGTGLYVCLAWMALRRKQVAAAAAFTLALVCLLGMGAAAQGSQTVPMQWMEESINSLGQLAFASGSCLLYKSLAALETEPGQAAKQGAAAGRDRS